MNNIERAIEAIEGEHDPHFGPIDAPSLVYALSNAGLLMPNFPEPDQDGDYTAGEHYISRENGVIDIYRYPAVRVASLMLFEVDGLIAALAAANHAEREQRNV